MANWKKVIVSGSSAELTSLTSSAAISASNINTGTPTANAWQSGLDGSYFNNFTSQTNVSEVLRFVAGLLSSSAPDASPNTKTYNSISATNSNTTTGTVSGYVPKSYTSADLPYLVSKGFAQTGSTLFSGLTVYTNSSYAASYTSVAAGSTTVSSSVDAQLFGLGTIVDGSTPTTFNVSGTLNWAFESGSSSGVTVTSQSENLLSLSSFTTSNGLTVGKINTANPAVIPPAYQDAKFASIFSSGLYNNGITATSVSASGYYHISASIKIASGSSAYSTAKTSAQRIFYAPIGSLTLNTQTISVSNKASGSVTATSSSLSGAPYLTGATWYVGSQVNGLFNPLYVANTNIASLSEDGALVTLASATSSGSSAAISSGALINTANTVFDSTGATPRATSTIPFETDIVKLSGSLTFSAGSGGATNIQALYASGLSPASYTVTTTGLDRTGASTTSTQAIAYHDAGAFSQESTSGSIAYFGFPTNKTETATSETFTDEANRITLNDSVLSFTGTAFATASALGVNDLQVKPGYLVEPGGTRRYWYPASFGNTYKYYVRKFQRTTSIASFTLSVGQTLVAWDDTTTANGVSVAIVFESAVNGQNSLTRTRLFDPYYTTGLISSNISANTAGTNPFGSAVDLYGIRSGAVSGTTYTVEISNANAVYMNGSSYDQFYVIIRYKGEPTTAVTTLSVS